MVLLTYFKKYIIIISSSSTRSVSIIVITNLVRNSFYTFFCWHHKRVLIWLCTEWRLLPHSSLQAAAAETGFHPITAQPFMNEQQQHAG